MKLCIPAKCQNFGPYSLLLHSLLPEELGKLKWEEPRKLIKSRPLPAAQTTKVTVLIVTLHPCAANAGFCGLFTLRQALTLAQVGSHQHSCFSLASTEIVGMHYHSQTFTVMLLCVQVHMHVAVRTA